MKLNDTPPVLFIVYNRIRQAEKVFAAIRDAQPSFLLISADGPKNNASDLDLANIEKCQLLAKQVDWPCTLITDFSIKNLGARVNVLRSINSFFNYVDFGIILEDDVLPSTSFFKFCAYALETYKDDYNIFHINGCNFQDGKKVGDGSYYFSRYPHGWGWATWRRAWSGYDPDILKLSLLKETNQIYDAAWNRNSAKYFLKAFMDTKSGKIDSWDYQWLFYLWINNGLCINPNANLVSLIGFNNDSTNCKDPSHPSANLKFSDIAEITPPSFRIPSKSADLYEFKNYTILPIFKRIISRIKWELGKFI